MEILFLVGLCVAIGCFADKRGRGGGSWFFISCCISPLLSGIILLCMKDLSK